MRTVLSKRSAVYTCICVAFCTAAFALQPTVRAGSVSLSSSTKPVTPTVAQTGSTSTDTSANRGAALFKFGKTTVPAVTQTTNNNNNSGSSTGSGSESTTNTTLAELQRQIEDLKSAQTSLEQTQTDLEHNQVTTETLATAIAEQVKNLDLTTNTDLKNTLSEIKSTNTTLQTSLNSVQQQAERLGDSLNSNIDSRLQYRGLLDSGNNLAFATKSEITPEALATKIAANPTATATLSEKITPKSSDIQKIIKADLIERQILDNGGNLNVEKKGDVQVTEATVTEALNNSPAFKNLVSQAATEKGFLTSESNTIQNLATKDAVTPEAIATKIIASPTAKQTLSGQIGPNEDSVKNLIVTDLKRRGIVSDDNNETLQLLKTEDLESKLNENNVITTSNMNAKLAGFAKTSDLNTLATKSEVTTLANKAITIENKNATLSDFVKNTEITPEILAAQIVSSPTAKQTLSGQIGPNEDAVKNLIVTDLKRRGIVSDDNNETLQLLKTADLDTKLAAKNFATSADVSGLTTRTSALETAVTATELEKTLQNKFAAKTSVEALSGNVSTLSGNLENISATVDKLDGDENITDSIANKIKTATNTLEAGINTKLNNYATNTTVNSLSGQMATLLNGDENTTGSIANKIKTAKVITEDNITNKLPENVVTTGNMNTKLSTFAKTSDLDLLATKSEVTTLANKAITTENKATTLADYAKTTDITPEKLATEIAGNSTATAALSEKITPKKTEIQRIIQEDLISHQILDNNGDLNVEKKGEVQVTESTITAALNNSNTFKNLVSQAATEKGFLTNESNTIKNLATKDTVTALSNTVDALNDDESNTNSVAYKIKALSDKLNGGDNIEGSIANKMKTAKIITEDNITNKLPDTVVTTDNMNQTLSTFAKADVVTSLSNTVNALNDDESNTNSIAYKLKDFAKADDVITKDSLANELDKEANATKIATKLGDTFAAKGTVESLSTAVNKLDGGEDVSGSIAYKIKELSDKLEGGDNVEGSIANKLKTAKILTEDNITDKISANDDLKVLLKGDAGTGINYRGEIANYNELASKTKTQGDAYYNNADGLLYICSGDGSTCSWPENTKGVRFRGEKGADAKTAERAYCDENLTIIQQIYGNTKDCTNFSYADYNDMTSGARAYCLSLAQKATSTTLKTDKGIGAKLEKIFGTGTVANLIQNKVGATIDNKNFVLLCEDKYDEIMTGKDGKDGEDGDAGQDAKSIEQAYCEANLNTVITPVLGYNNCDNFSYTDYNNLTSGAKGYCLSLALNASASTINSDKGVGLKLNKIFNENVVSKLISNKAATQVGTNNQNFVLACATKYDEIINPESAWYAYCTEGTNLTAIIQPLYTSTLVPDCKAFTQEQYNAIMGGPKAYCLALAQKAKSDNNNSIATTSGIGKTLEEVFGAGTVNVLKSSGVSAKVTISGVETNFVLACEKKYDEIMNPKSAWYSYCSEGTNLTDIVQPLYGVTNCKDFTQEQYNAIMGGPKAYCLLVAKNPTSSNNNVKDNLKKLFGNNIISTLSTNKVSTMVSVDGEEMKFVDACAKKYEDIMAGKDGTGFTYRGKVATYNALPLPCEQGDAWYVDNNEKLLYICSCTTTNNTTTCAYPTEHNGVEFKGEKGDDAKPVSQVWCEAQADNYPNGTTNLTLIQKLYSGVTSCSPTDFTSDMYAAITGGAKEYCLSLNASFKDVSLNDGVGLRIAKLYASKNSNKTLDQAKSELNTLRTSKNASQLLTEQVFGSDTLLQTCIANYNEIMSGEDAESVEMTYCKAQAKNYPEGTTNLTLIQKLYPEKNITSCADFDSEMYAAITGGAEAFCSSLNAKFDTVSLNEGIGLKLAKLYVSKNTNKTLDQAKEALGALKTNKTATTRLDEKIFGGKSLVQACIDNYDSIMSGTDGKDGEDAETAWHAYCAANNNANLTNIIKPLYGSGKTCDNFTSDEYNAIQGGAKAYCLSLVKNMDSSFDLSQGIGKKLSTTFTTEKMTALKGTSSTTLKDRLEMKGFAGSDDKNFITACEEKYNEIMSGTDGKDAKSVEQTYCEENLEIVKKLYPNNGLSTASDCADKTKFSNEEYSAIMGGAKAYCLSLAKNPSVLGDLSSGIGKKLSTKLGTKMADFIDTTTNNTTEKRLALTGFKGKNDTSTNFMTACEAKYDEIMAGDKGADAKSAEQTYCEANSADVIALFNNNNANPKITSASDCPKFTAEQYKAMTSGAKSYCLLLAKDFSAGKLTLEATSDTNKAIARKMNQKLKIGNTNNGILSMNDKSLSTVLTTKFNGGSDDFLTACEKTYNEIMAGDKGESGEDAVTTWCKEHTTGVATGNAKLSAAKMVRAYDKLGGTTTAAAKINTTTGRFNSLEDCINAVKADPSLMGGDSAADEDFNEDNKGKTITLSSETKTTLEGKKTKFQKVITDDNIGSKLSENNVITDTNFKSKLKTDLTDNEVKSTLSGAGFAKTDDVVTKDGLITELDKEANANKIATKLGNTFASKSAVDTLTSNDDTNVGSIAYKLKNSGFAKTTDVVTKTGFNEQLQSGLADNDVKAALSTAGFAKTDDVVTKNGFSEQLQGDLNKADSTIKTALGNTFAAKGTVDSLSTTVNTLNGTDSTEGSIAYKLKNSGFAKTTDVVTKTGFNEQLQSGLADNDVKAALSTAGFAKTDDVVTKDGLITELDKEANANKIATKLGNTFASKSAVDTLTSNDDTNVGSIAYKLKNSGFAKTSDVVTKDGFASQLQTDLNAANSTVKTALANAGFAKTTDVVTKNNLANELTSSSAQTALANAGFATKSNITNEVKSDVFTLADFSRLLSSDALVVDQSGKLKLADTATNAAAANVVTKITAAKANDASIQTTNLATTTSITSSIANVAANSIPDEITETDCMKKEYMYWNTKSGKCTKCPDGTYFDISVGTRCVCKESNKTFDTNTGQCVKANIDQQACLAQAGTYYYNTCEKCPSGTYFNEKSLTDSSLPRCICEDKSTEFNAAQGKCITASSCIKTKTVANPKNECTECPKEYPFIQTGENTGTCNCPAGGAFNIYRWGCFSCDAAGAEYNPETLTCTCPQGTTLNQEQWKCM